MNVKNLLTGAGGLILGLATLANPVRAQGPLYDKVIVDLPYTVTIGNKVLQPGNYVIRQHDSPAGGSRVLLIYSDKGMHFETSTMTIPALDNRTPENTKVVLHRFGNDYFFDKIWIQGKNYGYEFPLPETVKSRERERMQPVSVAARYESTSTQTDAQADRQTETTDQTAATRAQTDTRGTDARAQTDTSGQTEIAQAVPPTAPSASQSTASSDSGASTRSSAPTPRMPHTSADWITLLLSGGLLTSTGLMLRRSRA